jgi:hypothetical protein
MRSEAQERGQVLQSRIRPNIVLNRSAAVWPFLIFKLSWAAPVSGAVPGRAGRGGRGSSQ